MQITAQTTNDLSLPLIIRRKTSIRQVVDNITEENSNNNRDNNGENPVIGILLTCFLSFLLFLQFSISFPAASTPDTLIQTKTLNVSVFLFFLTSIIYRRTVQEADKIITTMALHLLPELVGLSTIGLCYAGHDIAGFVVLLIGKLIMSTAVVVSCAVELWWNNKEAANMNDKTCNTFEDADADDDTIVSMV